MDGLQNVGLSVDESYLKREICNLSRVSSDVLYKKLLSVIKIAGYLERIDLSVEEFTSVISLFNQKHSSYLTTSVFRLLLKINLTKDQLHFFFDCHKKQTNDDGPYSFINWSFLDKSVSIKRVLVLFIKHLVKKYPETAFEATRMLFLLLDDEDTLVRTRSYRLLSRISRMQWKVWTSRKKSQFAKSLKYFGAGGISILKSECRVVQEKKKKATIEIAPMSCFLRIHIQLGRKIRKAHPTITITGEEVKILQPMRKHTIVFCKNEKYVCCCISTSESILAKQEYFIDTDMI